MNNKSPELDVDGFLKALTAAFPIIQEIWLFGSRANGTERPDSDWDLLVVGDRTTLYAIAAAPEFRHPKIDLMVIGEDGDSFRQPWAGDNPKNGSLSDWSWRKTSELEAEYLQAKEPTDGSGWRRSEMTRRRAVRVWP